MLIVYNYVATFQLLYVRRYFQKTFYLSRDWLRYSYLT